MPNLRKKSKKSRSVTSFTERLLQRQAGAVCGVHFDLTLSPLEETRFRKKYTDLMRKLSKEVRLTYSEIESVMVIYYKIQKNGDGPRFPITREQFREVLHTAFDITHIEMNDILLYVLDKSPNQFFSMEAWVRAMSLFLRGTFEEKAKHCFSVFDMWGEGAIPRKRMLDLMDNALIGDDAEEVVKDLYDVIANKMDKDRDGKINYEDYIKTVTEEPLMMEVFGQCLPTRIAAHAFRTTFTNYCGKHY